MKSVKNFLYLNFQATCNVLAQWVKMSLTSCRALSTPGKFSNVDRYGSIYYRAADSWNKLIPSMTLIDSRPGFKRRFNCESVFRR